MVYTIPGGSAIKNGRHRQLQMRSDGLTISQRTIEAQQDVAVGWEAAAQQHQRTNGAWQAAKSGGATRGTEDERCRGTAGGATTVKQEATTNQRTRETWQEAGAVRGRGSGKQEATAQ